MQVTQVHAAPAPTSSPAPVSAPVSVPTSTPVSVPVATPVTVPSQTQRPAEGEARARYNFKAEGQRELPCNKVRNRKLRTLPKVSRSDRSYFFASP